MAAYPVRGWQKTTSPAKLARVEEVLRILLCGGELDDMRRHAADQGWNVQDCTLWQYRRLAFALIRRRTERKRTAIIDRHLATRRLLLARAMEAGDMRTALAVLRDEAELLGLYPEPNQKSGTNVNVNVTNNSLTIDGISMEQFKLLPTEEKARMLRG